jgi:hypothetical protein
MYLLAGLPTFDLLFNPNRFYCVKCQVLGREDRSIWVVRSGAEGREDRSFR